MSSRVIFSLILFISLNINDASTEEYFLTLRNDKVNLRQGPSFEYPIKIVYKKKYLPVLVQDKSDNFRKIRDHENNTGWIHISQLSKKKAAITIDNDVLLFKNATIFFSLFVILERGRLCLVKKCKEIWCKVEVSKFKGWIKKESLWGKL